MPIVSFFESAVGEDRFIDTDLDNFHVIVSEGVSLITEFGSPFQMVGTVTSVTMAGQLVGTSAAAIQWRGDDFTYTATETGSLITYGDAGALILRGVVSTTNNAGLISGPIGVRYETVGTATINNSGTIMGAPRSDAPGAAIYGDLTPNPNAPGELVINNSGLIVGQPLTPGSDPDYFAYAIDTHSVEGPPVVLTNTGEVSGDIHLYDRDDNITNSGTLSGRMDLEGGTDTVTNSGTILGSIYLGLGNDTYDGDGWGSVSGTVYGMGGNDIILGTRADERFDGGSSNDILRGHGGDDTLRGRVGEDYLFGGEGDDELIGDEWDDRLSGDNGNDHLDGGTDNDILRGGDGNDVLMGGTGRDVSFGGEGRDRFVFTSAADSTVGSTRDAIRDFERGLDQIDLEDLASGTLSYIGTGGFTGSAGQVRHVTTAGGSSVVRVDLDGDRVTDLEVLVQYTPTLSEADFLL